jgi:hypothetical protein
MGRSRKEKDIGFVEAIPNALIKKVRAIVAPEGKRGTWLRYLNDMQIAEVIVRLQAGIAAHRIVVLAQREWGVSPHSKPQSLSRAVRSLRDRIIPDLAKLPVRTPEEQKDRELMTKEAEKVHILINELSIGSWAIKEMVTRAKLWRDKEIQAKVPLKGADKTFMNLMSMLESNIEMKIKLGTIDPPTSDQSMSIKHKFDGLVTKVIGEDGKTKFLDAIDIMMDKIDDEALLLDVGPDGKFAFNIDVDEEEDSDEEN